MTQTWTDDGGFATVKVKGVPDKYRTDAPYDVDSLWALEEFVAGIIAKSLGLGWDVFQQALDQSMGGEWVSD